MKEPQAQKNPYFYESGVTISLATWKAAINELSWIFSEVPADRRYLKTISISH